MTQATISKNFHAALAHLLAKEGRGAQSRLAKEKKIDGGYLSGIVKGRKPASEKVRMKISDFFGLAYEDMLALGRKLQQDKDDISEKGGTEPDKLRDTGLASTGGEKFSISEHDLAAIRSADDASGSNIRISEKLLKTAEILESQTDYRHLLASMIDLFHEAVRTKSSNLELKEEVKDMEHQFVESGEIHPKGKTSKESL